MNQHSFSSLEQMHKKKCAKREIFLGEMEAVVPWTRLEALIDPYYTKPRKGCRYAVTRGTFPLSSQYWEEGDVYEQRSTRDTAQATDTSTR